MNDLDDTIRDGLSQATDGAGEITASDLADRLRDRRSDDESQLPDPGPDHSHRRWLAAAAVLVLLAGGGGIGVWLTGSDEQLDVISDDTIPTAPVGFDGWAPGWHQIDLGPVPATSGVSMDWFQGRVIVAGGTFYGDDGEPSNEWTEGMWAFDPVDREWSALPAPPFESPSIVAAGDHLVATGGAPQWFEPRLDAPIRWATWSIGDQAWTDRGPVPVAPQLRAAGAAGPPGPTGGSSLVWTGERVLDLTFGAILDPVSGESQPLPMPEDIIRYSHLIQATPVWTGEQVLLAEWSGGPGLAWDGLGRRLDDIPAPPTSEPNMAISASAVELDGRLVLVARSSAGVSQVASYDPATRRWTELPSVPEATEPWCPYSAATVGNDLIVQACRDLGTGDVATPLRSILRDGTWGRIPRPPGAERGIESSLGTDDAFFVWSSDDDTFNNDQAPYRWAAVWIPDPLD